MADVRMPKMGDGMEVGTINRWLKKEGDKVASGEPIAEVETDKASVEITAYDTGVLTKIVIPEGGSVPIGELIAVIDGPSNGAAPKQTAKPGEAPSVKPEPKAKEHEPAAETYTSEPETERVKASPLARRIAKELGIDLARVHGTGPAGRIVERDVKDLKPTSAAQPRTPAPQPAAAATASEIKPSRMREAIARRVTLSKQTIPHFYVTTVVNMDRSQSLLKEMNAGVTEGKITVNDLILKACAVSLAKVPEVNATWTADGTVKRFSEAHIGVAVGIDEGLIIPVVKNCESKTLRQISAEARELIGRARANQLKPEEYSGGTFSVSNLGMMGVDEFTAIINPPEAAILAIGGIVREPVVAESSDQIIIRSNMKITISADHRLLDGVIAARFVQEVKKALEAPLSLLS